MRGSPPLHLVLFAVGFALLAVPLAQLTFARPAPSPTPETSSPATLGRTPTVIRVRFAHLPQSVSLRHGTTELLPAPSLKPQASSLEVRTVIAIPPDGIELMLDASWPQDTPDTAVTVELEPDGLDTQSQTRWSSGTGLSELLSFHWKP